MTKEHYGFIGIGRMGVHMARRLIEAGHTLTIYDKNEAALGPLLERGAQKASSAAQVASAAETVFASLPTPDIVQTVAGQVATGNRIKTFVDLSTTGPRVAAAVHEALSQQNIQSVDCPVSGGVGGAEKGTLAVMVSCPRDVFDRLQPSLQVIGKVFFIGEKPGSAQTMKLCNNLLSVAALAISSEALVMGAKAGLDGQTMCDVINSGSGRNSATQDKFPKAIIPRTFDFGFATDLAYKDVKLCLEEAEALGVPMVVGNAVRQLLGIAKAKYGPQSDFTEIVKPVEEWAGVEVR